MDRGGNLKPTGAAIVITLYTDVTRSVVLAVVPRSSPFVVPSVRLTWLGSFPRRVSSIDSREMSPLTHRGFLTDTEDTRPLFVEPVLGRRQGRDKLK